MVRWLSSSKTGISSACGRNALVSRFLVESSQKHLPHRYGVAKSSTACSGEVFKRNGEKLGGAWERDTVARA